MNDYREYQPDQLNQELADLPDAISMSEYNHEVARVQLDQIEADLILHLPDEIKNAEQRKAYVFSNPEYLEQANVLAHAKANFHKLVNKKDCLMEIARNLRATVKGHFTDIKE